MSSSRQDGTPFNIDEGWQGTFTKYYPGAPKIEDLSERWCSQKALIRRGLKKECLAKRRNKMRNLIVVAAILALALLGSTALAATNTFPADGNVGIGTTSPTAKLMTIGDAIIGSGGYGRIRVYDDGTAVNILNMDNDRFIQLVATGKGVRTGYNTDFVFSNDYSVLKYDGNVGLGTIDPKVRLHNNGDFITKGPWVDVRAYGATGDGVTDDTSAIQNAINSIPLGGTVFLPRGNYKITSGLTITYSNTHLLGVGGKNSKIFFTVYGSMTYMISASGKENIRVEGLYLYGAGGPRSWTNDFGIAFAQCNDSAIVDNIVENVAGAAIAFSGTNAITHVRNGLIKGNIVKSTYSDGISGQYNDYLKVIENYVQNTGTDGANSSILFEGIYHSIIDGNVCDGNKQSILVANYLTVKQSYSIVSNNVCKGGSYGIFIAGTYNMVVEGNVCWRNSECGILIHDPLDRHQNQRNLIIGNTCYGSDKTGIGCSQNHNIIKGNTLVNNNWLNDPLNISGITLWNGASYNLVEGNYIYNVPDNEEAEDNGYQKYGVNITGATEVGNSVINNMAAHLTAGGSTILDGGTNTAIIGLEWGASDINIKKLKINDGTPITKHISATATWDPPSMSNGSATGTTVTVSGAALGDTVVATFDQIGAYDVLISGHVQAVNTVRVVLNNHSGSARNYNSGTIRVDVWKH